MTIQINPLKTALTGYNKHRVHRLGRTKKSPARTSLYLLKQKRAFRTKAKIEYSRHRNLARLRYSRAPRKALAIFMVLVLLAQQLFFIPNWIPEAGALSGSDTVAPDGDHSVNWATLGGSDDASCAGGTHCDRVDESSLDSSDYVTTGFASAYTAVEEFTTENPTISGTLTEVTSVDVVWRGQTMACRGNGGTNCDNMLVGIYINGAAVANQSQALTTTSTTYTTTFTGSWSTADDLRIRFERQTVGGGGGTTSHDDVRLYQAYATVNYNYNKAKPLLSLEDYIWENPDGADAQQTAIATALTGTNDTSSGTVSWTNPSYATFNYSNISVDDASVALGIGVTSHRLRLSGFAFDIPKSATIDGISVSVDKFAGAPNTVADIQARLIKADATESLNTAKPTYWPFSETTFEYGSSSNLWGLSWTPEEINDGVDFVFQASSAVSATNANVNFVQITVHYTPAQSTQLAAANTPVTVRKGEQATLRANIRNTGGPVDIENFGLFYDRNDGLWSKVDNSQALNIESGSNCDTADWDCVQVVSGQTIAEPHIAIDKNGNPWASYLQFDGASSYHLYVARYVGSGGTGCAVTSWTCTQVTNAATAGGPEILFDSTNTPWISYTIPGASGSLRVARYVATGGTGCATAAWDCDIVYSPGDFMFYQSMAMNANGDPVLAFQTNATSEDLGYAEYLGGATSGTGCNINTWNCTTVVASGSVGVDVEVTVDLNNNPWIVHRDTSSGDAVLIAYYDGDSTPSGCAVNSWTCETVQTTNSVPQPSIAVTPDNVVHLAYRDGSSDLEIAEYVGSGGSGCNVTTWSCTTLDTTGTSLGRTSDMVVNPSGDLFIVHFDDNNGRVRIARQHSGLSSGTGCSINTWTCEYIDTTSTNWTNVDYAAAIDQKGLPWITYNQTGANGFHVGSFNRTGEITLNKSNVRGTYQITESHTDMTSYDDSTNRNDADCTTTATWNNGIYFDGDTKGGGLLVDDGQSSAQCTEIAWTIDTSMAVEGETYRFVFATDDAIEQSEGMWRGPSDILNYPAITIEDSSVHDTTQWIETSSNTVIDPCGAADNWGCEYINNGSFDSGWTPKLKIAPDGTIWNTWAWNNILVASTYVGTGGSGCENLSTWNCTFIDSAGAGSIYYSDMALDSKGNPWIVYSNDVGDLKIATYDGDATASGCLNVAWTCRTIDDITSGNPVMNAIAINLNDQIWLTYESGLATGSLQMAQYVGTGGTGCTSGVTDWSCFELDSVATASYVSPSMAVGYDGNPWVTYNEPDNDTVYYARFVGSGGTGCTVAYYTCGILFDDGTGTVDLTKTKMTVGGPDNKVLAFVPTSTGARYAEYVGTGGTGCGAGNTAWTCTVIDTNSSGGVDGAFDAEGTLWVAFGGTGSGVGANIAEQVGTGGTGCAGGSTVWSCTNVATGFIAQDPDIAFDASGTIWFIGQIITVPRYSPVIFKYDYPMTKPTRTTVNNMYEYGKHATKSGGHNRLPAGRAVANNNALLCTGNNGDMGYCGQLTNDGQTSDTRSHGRTAPTVTSGVRFRSNTTAPNIVWSGKTPLPPSTTGVDGNLILQVYRFGTTNAWETITTDSSSTDCFSDQCTISGMPAGTVSEYYEADGSNYWIYIRLIQVDSYGSNITLETDGFQVYRTDQQLRGGRYFSRSLNQPHLN